MATCQAVQEDMARLREQKRVEALRRADETVIRMEREGDLQAAETIRALQARVSELVGALQAADTFIRDKALPYEPRMHEWLDVMEDGMAESTMWPERDV